MNRHILELRQRLLRTGIILLLTFIPFFVYAKELYSLLAKPLLNIFPAGGSLVATKVTSPFIIPLKLSFYTSLYIVIPYIIYQGWSFIGPALYNKERKSIFPLIISSCILFYAGTLFSYFILCPISLKFFSSCVSDSMLMLTDISSYLDYLLALLIGGGVAFQIPVITLVSNRLNLVSKKKLSSMRRHVIVVAFILGMLLTPPDVISQIILAVPIWLLYEVSLLACK